MSGTVTAGAGVLTAVLVAGTGLSRWWVRPARTVEEPAPRPHGRHRAPAAVPAAALVAVPEPEPVLVESLVIEERRCPTCRRVTPHVRFALGGLMCRSCRPREAS